jgi:hypothetical protein
MHYSELPVPSFFDPQSVGQIWRVPYLTRAAEAADWARAHRLQPASQDQHRIWLLMIDVQITFCVPDGELYVAGRNGNAFERHHGYPPGDADLPPDFLR